VEEEVVVVREHLKAQARRLEIVSSLQHQRAADENVRRRLMEARGEERRQRSDALSALKKDVEAMRRQVIEASMRPK
jgi:hypothetical protein